MDGWFNVIKGNYPAINMVTLDRPVKSGETGIVRGSCVYLENGKWRRATASKANDNDIIYFALQGQNNTHAIMAGDGIEGTGNEPKIAAIPCSFPMEVETDQFNTTIGGNPVNYTVGQFLSPGDNGKLSPWTNGKLAIGIVTAAPSDRWVNNGWQVPGWRTGTTVKVLRFQTVYLPKLAA